MVPAEESPRAKAAKVRKGKKALRLRSLLLSFAFVGGVCAGAASAEPVTYADQVRPLFQSSCLNCHNPDKHKAGLDLSTYEATMTGSDSGKIVEPGNAAKSLLFSVVTHTAEPFMPAKSDKLPDSEIELIKQWIEAGAPNQSGNAPTKNTEAPAAVGLAGVKPAGAIPMPRDLPLEPVIRAKRPGTIAALAGSPVAPLVAAAGQRQVLLFNTDTLELAGVLPFREGLPDVLRFSRDGQLLLAGGGVGAKLGRVVVWDVTTGRRVLEVGDEFDQVLAADLSPDGALIALGGPSKLVKIYSAHDGQLLHKLNKHTNWVTALSFTADGKALVTADRAGGLVVWDSAGHELQSISAHKAAITGVACAAEAVATCSEDGTIKLWDLAEGKERKSWEAHKTGVRAIAFATDGQLVSCGRDKLTKLWDLSGNKRQQFEEFADEATQTAGAGGRIIAGDWAGALRVWMPDGKRAGELDANPPTLTERVELAAARVRERTPAHLAAASALATAEKAAASLHGAEQAAGDLLQRKQGETVKLKSEVAALEAKLCETQSAWSAAQAELAQAENQTVLLASNASAATAAHEGALRAMNEREVGIQEKEKLAQSLTEAVQKAEAAAAKSPDDKTLTEAAGSTRTAAEKASDELAAAQKSSANNRSEIEQLATAAKSASDGVAEHSVALANTRAEVARKLSAKDSVEAELIALRPHVAQQIAECAELEKSLPVTAQQAKAADEAATKARAEEKKAAEDLAAAQAEGAKWTALAAAQPSGAGKKD